MKEPTQNDLVEYVRLVIRQAGLEKTGAQLWTSLDAQWGDVEVGHRWRREDGEGMVGTFVVTGETLSTLVRQGEAGMDWLAEQLKQECAGLRERAES